MLKPVFLIPLVLLVVGCSRYSNVITTQLNESSEPGNQVTRNITVFRKGEIIDNDKPYKILGKVFAERKHKKVNLDEDMIALMRTPAIKAGADALMSFQTNTSYINWFENDLDWGSAVAIKYVENETVNQTIDFMIDLLPISYSSKLDSLDVRESDFQIMNAARYSLEKLGYYVLLSNNAVSPEEIESMSVEDLERIGSPNSNRILLITLERTGKFNVAIAAHANAKINVKMINKHTGEVIIDKTKLTTTGGITTGLLNVLYESSARKNIVGICTEALISSMPSCHNGFQAGYEIYKQEEEKRQNTLERRERRINKKNKK